MSASRSVSRLSSRLQSFSSLKFKPKSNLSSSTPHLKSSSPNPTVSISRLPVELRSMVSMMPLHSAIASSRLTSMLSSESQSWGLIPQGIVNKPAKTVAITLYTFRTFGKAMSMRAFQQKDTPYFVFLPFSGLDPIKNRSSLITTIETRDYQHNFPNNELKPFKTRNAMPL